MDRRKPRPLTAGEARNSLANRLSRVVDRARQIDVRVGNRPYQVHLVWTKWNGDERGEGVQEVVCRQQLVPTPVVEDLTSITFSPFGAGLLPVGSVRVTEISASYRLEYLRGLVLPDREDQVPHPYDFFYEIVEDGRHECPPAERPRFRVYGHPYLDAKNQQWVMVLERTSGEMGKDGKPVNAPVVPPGDPRDATPPEDD
jgi:hypothetical protein